MAALRRLEKELSELRNSNVSAYQTVEADESNLYEWSIALRPEREPFNKGSFRVNISFPKEFPFKPPTIKFVTPIYHPNVDESGKVCLKVISPEGWKPAIRIQQVMTELVSLIHDPQPDHPLRAEVAEQFVKDRNKFNRTAEEHTRKHAQR